MLLNDFYTIQSLQQEGEQVDAHIVIDKDHHIFDGHFPDNPVTPGVCVLQIIKELTEKATDTTLFMEQSSHVKFKALIDPNVHPNLHFNIQIKEDETGIHVKNTTKFDDTIALTMKAFYKRI